MILIWLLGLPAAGGLLAWALSRRSDALSRWGLLVPLAIGLAVAIGLWGHLSPRVAPEQGVWTLEFCRPWLPALGADFRLGLDGLSLLMVVLSYALGLAAVIASWQGLRQQVGFFHLMLGLVLTGVVGVFLAADLFLFFFAWELMLVPMYFLIAIWGHENRRAAALKFVVFTQAGGVALLLGILALHFAAGGSTFAYAELLGTRLSPLAGLLTMLGFALAFAVKLPAFPFHPWLPDAHTEAPTAGSVVLAGLLLKTGAYGLIRFVLPLFPEPAAQLAPVAMVLGVVGILYGAAMAFAQTDLKRLVAYTSVSHLGFVLLGVFSRTDAGLRGAVVTMIAHGLSTGALFILVGALQDRVHTRDLRQLGGLWGKVPAFAAVFLVFALASLGLPGTGNFVGEFLVLLGTFERNPMLAAVAVGGLVLAAAYALRMMRAAFFGRAPEGIELPDLDLRERLLAAALIVALLWVGLFAQPVLNAAAPTVAQIVSTGQPGAAPLEAPRAGHPAFHSAGPQGGAHP